MEKDTFQELSGLIHSFNERLAQKNVRAALVAAPIIIEQ